MEKDGIHRFDSIPGHSETSPDELDRLKDRLVELIGQKQGLAAEVAVCHHERLKLEKKYRALTRTQVRTTLLLIVSALAALSMYIWVYRGC